MPESGHALCVRSVGGPLDVQPEMVVTEALARLRIGTICCRESIPAISVHMLLGPDTPEERLHRWMERIITFCAEQGVAFAGADASVGDAVTRDLLTVQAFYSGAGAAPDKGMLMPGSALYMAGYTGLAGCGIAAHALRENLLQRFSTVLVERGLSFMEEGALPAALPEGALAVWPVGEGGILGALWELGEYWNVGLDIDLRSVPVRQEMIEICDALELHPYQMYTCGAMLFTVEAGGGELPHISDRDGRHIPAVRIGTVTEGKARIARSGEEIRYVDKPAQDPLMQFVHGVLAEGQGMDGPQHKRMK